MYARRVAEAVELAKARARSIMTPASEAAPAGLETAGAKPKRPPRERAPMPGNAGKPNAGKSAADA
jgi:hypothetical protein